MGGVFCKKKWKKGVFCKKMKNGGCFFVKSGPFINARCIVYSIRIFYFTFYFFFGGGVRTHPTHPPAYGPGSE